MVHRKVLTRYAAALLVLGLAGCGDSSARSSEERASRSDVAPPAAAQPTPAPIRIKGDEICGLIRPEEVEGLLGHPLKKAPVPSTGSCSFWVQGGGVVIENMKRPHASLKGYTGARFAHELATWMASVGSEGAFLEDVADGAVQGGKLDMYAVWIVRGPHLFRIQTLGEVGDDTAEALVAVARTIGPRLRDLNGHPL